MRVLDCDVICLLCYVVRRIQRRNIKNIAPNAIACRAWSKCSQTISFRQIEKESLWFECLEMITFSGRICTFLCFVSILFACLIDVAAQTAGGCTAQIILEKLIEKLGKYCRRSRAVVCVFCAMTTQTRWTSHATTKTENLHKFSLVLPETCTPHTMASVCRFFGHEFQMKRKTKRFRVRIGPSVRWHTWLIVIGQ